MESKEGPGNKRLQWLIILSVCVASLSLGIISRWTTAIMGMLNIPVHYTGFNSTCLSPVTQVAKTNLTFSKSEANWLVTINAPSYVVGSLVSRHIADRYGRKAVFLWSAVPFAFGTILIQFPREWILYLTLIVWNIGIGMIMTFMGIYVAEVADHDIRGQMSLCTKYVFNLGQFIMLGIGPQLTYSTLNLCLLALPICFVASCFWIPETPYFHMRKAHRRVDKKSEKDLNSAKNILYRLRGYNADIDSDLTKMREAVKREMSNSGTFVELVTGEQYRRAIYVAVGLKVTQIMSGLVTIQQYLIPIMRESTFCMKETTAMLIFASANFGASIMSFMLIDKVGRRPLLIGTYFGTGVCLLIVATYFYCRKLQVEQAMYYGFVPFVGVTLANVFATVGFSSIGGVVTAEIFPLNVKAVAITSLSVLAGILGFAVGKLYGIIDKTDVSLWVYASFSILGGIFSCYFVTETKGKPLRDIVNELAGTSDVNASIEAQEITELKRDAK